MSSSKLPVKSGLEVVKALTKVGFIVRKAKGSHVVLQRGNNFVVVPMHKELKRGMLLEIIRESGMTREEFLSLF